MKEPATSQGPETQFLFVTRRDYSKVSLSEYRLPLRPRERPMLSRTGVSEPVPIAADERNLFVASFNMGELFSYPLPLGPHSNPNSRPAGVGDPGGLALTRQFLFVSGSGRSGNEVLEYKLPIAAGEAASASLGGFPIIDELSVAAEKDTLFVSSTTRGTVSAYRLPLSNNEAPEYTIVTQEQNDASTSIAVDAAGRHLYVSLSTVPSVFEYHLPYHSGEMPRVLNLQGGLLADPDAVAVGQNHLFVSTEGDTVWSYPLPLSSHSAPDGRVSVAGGSLGLAVSQ